MCSREMFYFSKQNSYNALMPMKNLHKIIIENTSLCVYYYKLKRMYTRVVYTARI